MVSIFPKKGNISHRYNFLKSDVISFPLVGSSDKYLLAANHLPGTVSHAGDTLGNTNKLGSFSTFSTWWSKLNLGK